MNGKSDYLSLTLTKENVKLFALPGKPFSHMSINNLPTQD
jgi:hypothetical protein